MIEVIGPRCVFRYGLKGFMLNMDYIDRNVSAFVKLCDVVFMFVR